MDQIPRMCDLLAPAVDALLADLSGSRRADRERAANHGRYGDIIRGWGGQAAVIRARLTKEVRATRLDGCKGTELADLARSEFFADLPNDPQQAVGEATLERTVTNNSSSTTGTFGFGIIAKDVKLKRSGLATATVPRQDAEYQVVQAVTCGTDDTEPVQDLGGGSWLHTQRVLVPIEATRAGPHANHADYLNGIAPLTAAVSTTLFDKFTVQALACAGGSLGVVDDQIRALARAMSTGSNGPTARAAIAGTLTNPGARRAVYADNPVLALGRVFAADESWATSDRYRQGLLQTLRARPWIGWGCRVGVLPIENLGIVVRPTVLLRSSDSLSVQVEITDAIKTALVKYFDERPDFYTWTLNAIGGIVGGADRRILACTAVSVLRSTGELIAAVDGAGAVTGTQPDATISPTATYLTHYALVGQVITPTYETPGG